MGHVALRKYAQSSRSRAEQCAGSFRHSVAMSHPSALSEFHHWLLDGKPDLTGHPHVIVLYGAESFHGLTRALAHYLNEYDDEAHGHWMAAQAPLIESIAGDATQRKLLGVDQACEKCPPTGPCGLRKVIKALAQQGHVVFDSPHAAAATESVDGVFYVSLSAFHKDCHMHLNASRFHQRCLAPIIADVYLEWFQCSVRRQPNE